MSILGFISSIFKPAVDIVDKVHTSEAEKLQLRNALAKIEAEVQTKTMEFQQEIAKLQVQLAEASAKVAVAESTSESWFVRHYRPIIITSMFALIIAESFGLLKTELPEVFWQIFAAAFGVMSVAPGIAKAGTNVAKTVMDALTKKK